MKEDLVTRRPTPADLRRAGGTIVFASIITALLAYRFWIGGYEGTDEETKMKAAAFLFWAIAAVDLFVGVTVLAFSNRWGDPRSEG